MLNSIARCGIRCITGALLAFAAAPLTARSQTAAQVPSPIAPATRESVSAAGANIRMLLLLRPGAERAAALASFLAEAQRSHAWLRPSQFGARFGVTDSEAGEVTAWLNAQGFSEIEMAAGRGWVEFTGPASLVKRVFGPGTQSFFLENAPAQIQPHVLGIVSASAAADLQAAPAESDAALTPLQFAEAYNLDPVYARGLHGEGQSVAIITRSRVDEDALRTFRANFGLAPAETRFEIADGQEPGFSTNAQPALFAASWIAAVAPAAQIHIIAATGTNYTNGLDLASAYAVDHAEDGVLLFTGTVCSDSSSARAAFYRALWRQAAAEGITVIAPAGDTGAFCGGGRRISAAATGDSVAVGGVARHTGSAATAWSDESAMRAGGGGLDVSTARPQWQRAAGVPAGASRTLPDLALPVSYVICQAGDCSHGLSSTLGGAAAFAGAMALADQSAGAALGNVAPSLYALARRMTALVDITEGSTAMPYGGFAAGQGYDLATGLGTPDLAALIDALPGALALGTAQALVTTTPAYQNIAPADAYMLTAKAVPANGSGPTATGTVTFVDSLNGTLGTVQLSNGQGTFTGQGALSTGNHSVTAQYSGDSNYAAGNASPVTIIVQQAPVTFSLSTPSLTPVYGSTLTATVAIATTNTPAPTGTVTFSVDSTPQTSATLTGASLTQTATVTLNPVTPGVHTLGAIYNGDQTYQSITAAPVTVTVMKGPTTTSVVASPEQLTANAPETLTATITSAAPNPSASGRLLPFTGNILFYDGTTPLGTSLNVVNGVATLANITLDPSVAHSITAVYYGDGNWLTSTSSPLALKLVMATAGLRLVASPASALPGTPVSLTATASGVNASAPGAVPTGSIYFYDDSTPLGAATLNTNLGVATAVLSTSALASGSHQIIASYQGDKYFSAVNSTAVTVVVDSYSITPSANTLTLKAGAAGTINYQVAQPGGQDALIQLGCLAPAGSEITCGFLPSSIQGSGKTVLTVSTAGPGVAASGPGGAGSTTLDWLAAGVAVLFAMAVGMRGRRVLALVLLACVGISAGGCGATRTITLPPGTPPGTQVLTITAAISLNNQTTTQISYISVLVQ